MLRHGGPPDASSSLVEAGVPHHCKLDASSSQADAPIETKPSDKPSSSQKHIPPKIILGPEPKIKAISPFTLTIDVPPGWDPDAWSTKTITTRVHPTSTAPAPTAATATEQGGGNELHSTTLFRTVSASPPTATTPSEDLKSSNNAGVKVIPAAIVGGFLGLAAASLGVWWVFRRMKRMAEAQMDRRNSGTGPGWKPRVAHDSLRVRPGSGKGHGKMVETRCEVQNEARSSVVHGGDGFF